MGGRRFCWDADCVGYDWCLLMGKAGDAACILGVRIGEWRGLLKGKAGVCAGCVSYSLGGEDVGLGKLPLFLDLDQVADAGVISLLHSILTFDAFYRVNVCAV